MACKEEKIVPTNHSQLLLDITATPDISAQNYLPLNSHSQALLALQTLSAEEGFQGLRISGAKGTGKTHLLKAWAASQNAKYFTPQTLTLTEENSIVIDALESALPEQQETAFHIYNSLKSAGGKLIISSTIPITPKTEMLPDLRSRLLTLPTVELTTPTEADLTQLLIKWATDFQLTLRPEVVKYLLSRADRCPATLHQLITTLDTLSLTEKRAVTLPLVRKVLAI